MLPTGGRFQSVSLGDRPLDSSLPTITPMTVATIHIVLGLITFFIWVLAAESIVRPTI